MLKIRNLTRTFGQTLAVDNVDFSIDNAAIVALYGDASGSDKTTLLNIISGHLQPDSGQIFYNDKDIIPLNPCQRKKLGLSCVVQEEYLFDDLTIADHILAVARNSTTTINELYAQWRMDSQFLKKSFKALAYAGIDVPIETKIRELSAIKKKLLTVGLAMLEPFELLVWEEPYKGIDKACYKDITKMILEVKRENKVILFTCDELEIAQQVAEQIMLIKDGKISSL